METNGATSPFNALVDHFRSVAAHAPEDTVVAALALLDQAAEHRERAAFIARAAGAVADLARTTSTRTLIDAAGARSDLLVLTRALEDAAAQRHLLTSDPLAAARLRGLLARYWLLDQEGGVCTASQLGQLLGGLSRQGIDKRRIGGRLLALNVGKRGYVYPVWQVQEGRVLAGLDRVLEELDAFDPWMQAAFFLNPNTRLNGETPLAELRRGHVERSIDAAATYAA